VEAGGHRVKPTRRAAVVTVGVPGRPRLTIAEGVR